MPQETAFQRCADPACGATFGIREILHAESPYEDLCRSYGRLMAHLQEKGYHGSVPYREIYLKGPGLLFRGNPKGYLTEIQILIGEPGTAGDAPAREG